MPVPINVASLAEAAGDTFLRVYGSPEATVTRVRPLDAPQSGCLTFARAEGDELKVLVMSLPSLVLICKDDPVIDQIGKINPTLICVTNPRLAMTRILRRHFASPLHRAGIHPSACVDPDADVHPTASIGAFCYIGANVCIGENTVLFPNVSIYPNTKIGNRVTIHSGSVIGADGFGFERSPSGELEKFPQIGTVVIEDDVEIGASCTIDRGAIGDTVIGQGAKLDDQIHVGHNTQIGRNVVVAAQSMFGGGVRIGDNTWIAPSSAVMNKVSIGSRATVGLGAVVIKDVKDGETVMGSPAMLNSEFRAMRAALRKITE